MNPKDLLLILLVIIVWGLNFIAIKIGLQGMPPLLLAAMRFSTLLPVIFFIKPPKLKFRWLLAYSLLINFGQFAFLFSGIAFGMPAGMSSLVAQAQPFFTIFLAFLILKENIKLQNMVGLCVSALGLILISTSASTHVTALGMILTLFAALFWAAGNIVIKMIKHVDMMSLTIWGGLLTAVPFWICSFWFEGTSVIQHSFSQIHLITIIAVLYLTYAATVFGYGMWAKMLTKYPAGTVTPFTLLVPVVGLSSSAVYLNEQLTTTDLVGTVVVMTGLCINVFWDKFKPHPKKP